MTMLRSALRIGSRASLIAGFALAVAGIPGAKSAPRAPDGENQQVAYFSIGTSGTSGAYFPVGSVLANAISNPPGSLPCDRGGSCGAPQVVAVAQSTAGDAANLLAVGSGALDSGLSRGDMALWAYRGEAVFAGQPGKRNLRAVTRLFTVPMHVVVSRKSDIREMADLAGKRISLGEAPDSGTALQARKILAAYGVTNGAAIEEFLEPDAAAAALQKGRIDAFFVIGPGPVTAISRLAERVGIRLLSLDGQPAAALRRDNPAMVKATIPARLYRGTGAIETLGISAIWVVSAELPEERIYEITRALWHPTTLAILHGADNPLRDIRLSNALDGVRIPLHVGARHFYIEAGLIKK